MNMTPNFPLEKTPFDLLRDSRRLAPHSSRLNARRWLIGDALRRLRDRAQGPSEAPSEAQGEAPAAESVSTIPAAELAAYARAKLADAHVIVGAHAWPIVHRVVIKNGAIDDCLSYVFETGSKMHARLIALDRLRGGLDSLADLTGVRSPGLYRDD